MRTGATRRKYTAGGFTLIEMIVVLVVLGLVLGLVIARGPARSQGLDLSAAAKQVAGMLRLARSRAIAEDRAVAVDFGTRRWSDDILVVGDHVINFTPDGGSSGGRIILHGGDRLIAVDVDWLTGRIQIRAGRGPSAD